MNTFSVLLLEDNQGDARLIDYMLSSYDDPQFRITHVERLNLAKDALLEGNFEVALVDLTVPDSRGMATISAILEVAPDTPLVVLTGIADEKTGHDAVQKGAQDFLVKGEFDEQLLVRTISFAIFRQKMANELRASEDRTRRIIESNADGIVVVDGVKSICFVNPSAQHLFGMSAEEILGTEFSYPCRTGEVIEIAHPNNGHEIRTIELHCVDIDWHGNPAKLLSLRDVSSRVVLEKRLRHMATHDPLTGIPNRTLFEDRLKLAIRRYQRYYKVGNRDCNLAVILLDLDEFKQVNDTYGHPQGDVLLTEIASRLVDAVRDSDTVARLGGDEFVIVAEHIEKFSDLQDLILRIMKSLYKPIQLDEIKVQITTSVGVSCYPCDGEDYPTLFKNADIALYQAKETRNRCCFYNTAVADIETVES